MDEGYTIYVASGLPMGLCVIFLNIFVLKCIGLRASESDVTFTFIRHNAVADTILGLLTLYQTVYNLHKYDVLRECLLRYGMICGTTLASLLTIFGLNMDRFIKVVLPLRYDRIVSPLVVRVYLVFVWSVAVAGYIAPQLKVLSQNLVPKDCNFFVVLGSDYTCVVGTVILTVVGGQLYMYLHIFSVAVSKIVKDRQVVFDVSNGGQGRTFHDWWKPIRVVLLIVGLNACSVTPVGVYLVMASRGLLDQYSESDKERLLQYVGIPCFFNSALNPVLYSYKIPRIRQALVQTLCCKKKSHGIRNHGHKT